ncbi:hypothetical protein L484_000244 [Morus notabilis]|uniref:Uncharacterized protein n=1 Tax=Morus notabilis TaxID=981085 RepID=W9SEW5_9ROSA|nr:hypothetical protein L484_000244 [Morus notabilis]
MLRYKNNFSTPLKFSTHHQNSATPLKKYKSSFLLPTRTRIISSERPLCFTDVTRSQPLKADQSPEETLTIITRSARSFHNRTSTDPEKPKMIKIKGTVVLMKKNVLDFNDFNASVLDRFHELVGRGVSLWLVSAVHADPGELF